MLAGEDALPVGWQTQRHGGRTGCQDDVAGAQQLPVDVEGRSFGIDHQPAAFRDHPDAAGADQAGQSAVQPRDQGIRETPHLGGVHPGEDGADPQPVRLGDCGAGLGRLQPCLGGHTPPVQAGAAQLPLLYQCHVQPELRGPQGGRVAGGAAAQDGQVMNLRHAGQSSILPA